MILRILKSNRQTNFLTFSIVALLLWLKSLLWPFSYQFFEGENNMLLFKPIYRFVQYSNFLQVLLSLIFVVLLALLVQLLNNRYLILGKRIKLPATLFVIVVSGFTGFHTLHPVLPATLFLLFALYSLFGSEGKAKPYSNIFNAGFLLGIGALFYFNLVILFPAFLIGVAILSRGTNWRGFVIVSIGFLLPFLFTLSYAFLTEQTLEIFKTFEENILTPVNHFRTNIQLHAFVLVLILLTLAGSIKIFQQYDSKKVSTRKYFSVLFLLFLFSILSFVFIPVTSQEMFIIITIPVTYLVSNLFNSMKSRFWSELLFLLLIGIVIFMQFSDKFNLNG